MNWYEIKSQQGAGGETDIFIFDEIGMWGVSADRLINEIQRLKPTSINLHVNSPGGGIIEGLAIYNYLRAHSARVTVYIDSLAASIAGVIAMSGDEIVMAEASLLHMHLPGIAGYISEKVDGLEELAGNLRKMDQVIRNIYKKRGATDEQLAEWMAGETYFTAQEALSLGLVDRVEERVRMVACAARWDSNRYPSIKKALARHPDGPHTNTQPGDNNDMSDELKKQIGSLTTDLATANSAKQMAEQALEAEKKSRQEAIDKAVSSAKADTLDAQTKRIEAIASLAEKYGQDGDLDAQAMQAIKDGKSADEFKDAILDVIAKRPTTPRAEAGSPDGGKGGDAKTITTEEYLAKSHQERRAFKAAGGIIKDA